MSGLPGVLVLAGVLGVAGGACPRGDEPPLPWDAGALGDAQPLTLTQATVSLQNDGPAYQATLSLSFRNPQARTVEGVCFLPVAPGAVERSFAVENDGVVMQGQVRSRDRVLRVYGDITRNRGKDPAVLERLDDEWMRATISPVAPRGEVVLHLTSIGLLEKFGTLRAADLAVPTSRGAAGGRIAYTVQGKIHHAGDALDVVAPGQILEGIGLTSTGHSFDLRGPLAHERLSSVFLEGLDSPEPVSLSCFRTLDEDGYFFLEVDPAFLLARPLEAAGYAVVVDPTGSVRSSVWDAARAGLRAFFQEIGAGDRVALLSTVGPEVRLPLGLATTEYRARAQEVLGELERGARRRPLGEVLSDAARELESVPGPRRILLVSPGIPEGHRDGVREAVHRLVGQTGDVALFTLAMGTHPDVAALDEVAELGSGRNFPCPGATHVQLLAPTLVDAARRPVLRFPEVAVAGATELCSTPRRSVTFGDTLTLAGRYPGGGETAIRLRGELAGRRVEELFGGILEPQRLDQPWVATLWAAQRVADLRRQEDQALLSGACVADFTLRLCERFGILGEDTVSLALEPALSASLPQFVGPAAALDPPSPFAVIQAVVAEIEAHTARPRGVPIPLTPARSGLVSPLASPRPAPPPPPHHPR